jgi:hypothetical protein
MSIGHPTSMVFRTHAAASSHLQVSWAVSYAYPCCPESLGYVPFFNLVHREDRSQKKTLPRLRPSSVPPPRESPFRGGPICPSELEAGAQGKKNTAPFGHDNSVGLNS